MTVVRERGAIAAIAVAALAPVIVMSAYSFATSGDPLPGEYPIFGPAGAAILTGNWAGVFDDAAVQAGPFQLVLYGVPWVLGTSGVAQWMAFYSLSIAMLTLVFAFCVVFVLRSGDTRLRLAVTVGALAAAIFGLFLPLAVFLGHPSQVVIPALWALAGVCARHNRFVAAAVLVAVSAGWESWGVLGASVIFLAAHPRFFAAAVAGLSTIIAIYGPFLALGNFRMLEYVWPVRDYTLVSLLFPEMDVFPWSLRVLQALFALAAGLVAARLTRHSRASPWIVAISIVGVRLLADPLTSGYYWTAAAIAALGLLAVCIHERKWLMTAISAFLVVTASVQPPQPLWATISCLALTVVVIVVFRRDRDFRTPQAMVAS